MSLKNIVLIVLTCTLCHQMSLASKQQITDDILLEWIFSEEQVNFIISAKTSGWVGLGFSLQNDLEDSEILIAGMGENTTPTDAPPTTSTPDEPTTATPEEPTTATPKEPTTATPDEPTTATPEEPTTATPDEPTTATPDEPTTATPEEPTTATPEEPTTATPEDPTTVTPEEPTTVTPEEPTTVTPEEPTTVTPDEPTTDISEEPTTSPDGSTDTPSSDLDYLVEDEIILIEEGKIPFDTNFIQNGNGNVHNVRLRREDKDESPLQLEIYFTAYLNQEDVTSDTQWVVSGSEDVEGNVTKTTISLFRPLEVTNNRSIKFEDKSIFLLYALGNDDTLNGNVSEVNWKSMSINLRTGGSGANSFGPGFLTLLSAGAITLLSFFKRHILE